jgi:virginiamycin B lyase
MGFSYYYYGITIILLVTVIPVYDIALTATTNTTTTISRTSYVATAFSNESAITQRPDEPQVNASRVTTEPTLQEFPVPTGSRPHDVAPAANRIVWYIAQGFGELGRLDTSTNQTHHIALGPGSVPHGVIVGPDGAPWITDGGLNAIVRVDPETEEVRIFPLPEDTGYTNLNTAAFDKNGTLWFTGQSGIYGRLDPAVGQAEVFDAPRGQGPYGISTAPNSSVYYTSLAGSYIARIDLKTGAATMLEPPTLIREHGEFGLTLRAGSG